MAKPIYIKVGGPGPYDPAAGTTDCNIPSLKGADIYLDNKPPASYTVLSTGGFRVVIPFVLNDEYYVMQTGISYGTQATAYTNGFCFEQVIAALFGRVGWNQPTAAGSPVLNANNLLSKSGRKFNDGSFHALVSIKNIKETMEDEDVNDANFNAYLEGLQRAVILRSLNTIFNEPELIDQSLLYDRWGYQDTAVENTGKFIAVRIKVPPAIDLATQIDSVSLWFNEDVTFNLYLFNDVKKQPVWVGEVSAVANTQTVVDLSDIILNHIGGDNHGGIFYFGYFQDDLGTAKALRELNGRFKTGRPYLATMVEAPAVGGNDFVRDQIGYSYYQSYGMNLHLSVFRDHTWKIKKKAALLDNANGLQMAAMVIEQINYSTRSNGDERILKDQSSQLNAAMDLTGTAPISDGPKTVGLRSRIETELGKARDAFFPKPKPQSQTIPC